MNQNPFMNNQGMQTPQPQPNMQPTPYMNQTPYSPSELNDLMKYRVTYPEIYYKCQPFVMMACDQMDTYTSEMPTQEMIEQMSDNIYDDVCRMYPDLDAYAKCAVQQTNAVPAQTFYDQDRDRDMFGRRYRRRGAFRDFIDFLLLSELLRRRRRFY